MRSPAGSIRNHISTPSPTPAPTDGSRKIVVTTPLGVIPAPTTAALVSELRGAIAAVLVDIRDGGLGPKDRALTISHLTRSIACLVGIEAMDNVDLTTLSDTDLVDLGERLIRDVVGHS
jgi:hypothetical protein